MPKQYVKLTKKGDIKITLSKVQVEDFLALLDQLETYQDNSYMFPLQRLWNTVSLRLKDRFTSVPYEAQSITLKKEEAIVINANYVHQSKGTDTLGSIMLGINQKLT